MWKYSDSSMMLWKKDEVPEDFPAPHNVRKLLAGTPMLDFVFPTACQLRGPKGKVAKEPWAFAIVRSRVV